MLFLHHRKVRVIVLKSTKYIFWQIISRKFFTLDKFLPDGISNWHFNESITLKFLFGRFVHRLNWCYFEMALNRGLTVNISNTVTNHKESVRKSIMLLIYILNHREKKKRKIFVYVPLYIHKYELDRKLLDN